jgi:hypothetical protein
VIGQGCLDDQGGIDVDARWCVVGLLETAAGGAHDLRLLIGEVDLVFARRSRLRLLRLAPPRLLAGPLGTRGKFVLGLLGLVTRLSPGLNLLLGHCDHLQSLLAPRQLQRHVHPLGQRLVVGLLGQTHQFLDLVLERLFDALGVRPTQGFVLAGVGLDLGPVQADFAQLHQPHRPGNQQDLDEQPLTLAKKTRAEIRDGAEIGRRAGPDEEKRKRVASAILRLVNTPVA